MTGAHKESAFEESVEKHLVDNGWLQGESATYDRVLGLDPSELFAFIAATQAVEWEKYVALQGGESIARVKAAKRIGDEISSRGMIDVIRRGVKDTGTLFRLAYFAPAHELTPELRDLHEANRLTVVRQAHVSESNPADSVDLLLLLNGLPVATAELKTQFTGQNIENAIEQYRVDRNPSDLIFRERSLVHFAFDQDNVAMTTKLTGKATEFLPFNLGSAGPGHDGGSGNPINPNGARTAYLWEKVWQRDNWLDLLASFIHVSEVRDKAGKKTGKKFTIFPRFHQWDAVNRLLDATKVEGPGFNKLIQHSAGSGKSNTIAWLAHGLSRLHSPANESLIEKSMRDSGIGANMPIFDKVIVVTDRKILDRQLQDTVSAFDHTPGVIEKIDEDSQQLRRALEGKRARVIITTLQKFPVVAQAATELAGSRFAVIVDEAHSSQSGEAVKDLKSVLSGKTGDDALAAAEESDAESEASEVDVLDFLTASMDARGKKENLTFFAFTATPKHKTLSLFGEKILTPAGDERFVPFHLYSMKQAIEEGFILDVLANYTTYKTYYRLANGLTSEDPELPKGKAAAALARYVSLHPTNLAQKAEIIVEHFRAHTSAKIGGRAKAMVVTRSRLHAVRYFEAINKYIVTRGYDKGENAMRTLVAFSGTVVDPDAPNVTYRESILNGFPESQLPEQFDGDYQVLVVAEKYQTGFDQPLLHTMYVDKRLDGVKAVQTLSRLNRMAPGKSDTFILDFANDAEDIQASFAPFFTKTTASPSDPNMLYNLQDRINQAAVIDSDEVMQAIEGLKVGGAKGNAMLNAATDPAVERWHGLETDADREDFRTALRDFTRAYAFLAQIVPYQDVALEALYYYGKYLLTRLPRADTGAVDIDGSVVLTHLRTDLIEDQVALRLSETDEPLGGAGEGRGKQHEEPTEPLSVLIANLNERFGMNLTDADRIWFEQQKEHFAQSPEARVVALGNDLKQFGVWLKPQVDEGVVERNESNATLFSAYFDKPEFREKMVEWLTEVLYTELRTQATGN
jgi:type I restriction enzyme R subunit